jgi:hypothetical protein
MKAATTRCRKNKTEEQKGDEHKEEILSYLYGAGSAGCHCHHARLP